ncbi:MAG: hypothetical protein GXO94_05625, partial [Nitrospirae bacterium]|nr:hypothetical protein [Nitrospirota bacterium]
MKKVFIVISFILLSAAFLYSYADAKVSGVCSNCHTMHNSQGGAPMTYDSSSTPNGKLLRGSCVGCHAQNTSSNIVNSIPQVYHTASVDLSG